MLKQPQVCQFAFSRGKIMTAQNKSSVTEDKLSWLMSKFALGRRATPKAFEQIFHSQKPIQVNKCCKKKKHSSDPKVSQICVDLRFLDGSTLTYIHVGPETEKLLKKKIRTVSKNSIIKAPR